MKILTFETPCWKKVIIKFLSNCTYHITKILILILRLIIQINCNLQYIEKTYNMYCIAIEWISVWSFNYLSPGDFHMGSKKIKGKI